MNPKNQLQEAIEKRFQLNDSTVLVETILYLGADVLQKTSYQICANTLVVYVIY